MKVKFSFAVSLAIGGLYVTFSIAEEAWQQEAHHLYPPVVSKIDMPKYFVAGKNYNIGWQLTGYLDEYDSSVRFYTDNNSDYYSVTSVYGYDDTSWSYTGQGDNIKLFDFSKNISLNFTVTEPEILNFRFFKKGQTDEYPLEHSTGSGSALIPTNKTIEYVPADTRGRILKTVILPNSNWYTGYHDIELRGNGLNYEDSFVGYFGIYNEDPESGIVDFYFKIEAGNGFKNGVFIAVIDKADEFLFYPGFSREFKYKTDDGDWITLMNPSQSGTKTKQFSQALGSLAGVYAPDGVSEGAGILTAAMNVTKLLFNVLDREWWNSGLSSEEAKLLPDANFLADSADLGSYQTFRMVLPQPATVFSDDIVGYEFSVQIKHDWVNASVLPRFYFKVTNTEDINEEVSLQLGNSNTDKFEDYLTDSKFKDRWVQIYE